MKMYILIKDDIPLGKAIVAASHASLACYLKYKDNEHMEKWINPGPFFKVVCKANPKEFENAKQVADHVVLTESSLANKEVAIVFCPRPDEEWPKMFKFLRLYTSDLTKHVEA